MEILLVARALAVQKILGPQLCLCPTFLSISAPHPHPSFSHPQGQRASELFSSCLKFWLTLQTWGREPGSGWAYSPEEREPLVVSWFMLMLIDSFQLELFKLWLDQFYMSSHWGCSRLGLFLYVQSEVENWGNYLQANESGLCNQSVLITGQNWPHAQSFALS